ncbi:hypothetical protein EDB89DRAFT_2075055 [Lactarius sanguifluus]|nr:hypothetical protein EDB89DRAFT_2075055 [Lactarius sanguifluus]
MSRIAFPVLLRAVATIATNAHHGGQYPSPHAPAAAHYQYPPSVSTPPRVPSVGKYPIDSSELSHSLVKTPPPESQPINHGSIAPLSLPMPFSSAKHEQSETLVGSNTVKTEYVSGAAKENQEENRRPTGPAAASVVSLTSIGPLEAKDTTLGAYHYGLTHSKSLRPSRLSCTQIPQRKYAPLHRARMHQFFSQGARKFDIFGFVDVLSALLCVSLFFAGLAVFAFHGNHIAPSQSSNYQLHKYWNKVGADIVKLLDQQRNKDKYKNLLLRTLRWLSEDHEVEDVVAGIPACMSPRPFPHKGDDIQRTIRPILADLPELTSSRTSLFWIIVQLAQRASMSGLPKSVQQRRTRACLRALYYIPGAIRDILAAYTADEQYYLEILPLLNAPELLEIIDELWDTPNDAIALSVRDSARLQNIERFLTDLKDMQPYMGTQWWIFDNVPSIRRERLSLFNTRHTVDYRMGYGTFDRHGDRALPMFLPAAQQDFVTLTIEILARAPVADTAPPQHEAFLYAYEQLAQEASIQADERAQE